MRMLIIYILSTLSLLAQGQSLTYLNHGEATELPEITFYSNNIHEIKLSPDGTFGFTSRPTNSCLTWRDFKGTWKKVNDTLYFSDKYPIEQDYVTTTYKNNQQTSFVINFRTDKDHPLLNKKIQITYIYDYYTELKDVPGNFTLNADNTIEIPFRDIPSYQQLSSIKIDYLLNSSKRNDYLTTNQYINVKKHDIPNLISVVFVENPKKDTIYRITKGVIRDGKLFIISTQKSTSILKDYGQDLTFEDGYLPEKS